MQKILFFISQDLYAKHYLTYDSFKVIEKKYECSYLAGEDVKVFKEKISKKKKLFRIHTKKFNKE